jgi:hypothetical protein
MSSIVAHGIAVAPGSYADRVLSTDDPVEKEKILKEMRDNSSSPLKIEYKDFLDVVSFEDILNNNRISVKKLESKEFDLTLPILIDFLKSIDCIDRTIELALFCDPIMFSSFRKFGRAGVRIIDEEIYKKIGCFMEVFGIPIIVSKKFPVNSVSAIIPDRKSCWPDDKFNMTIFKLRHE